LYSRKKKKRRHQTGRRKVILLAGHDRREMTLSRKGTGHQIIRRKGTRLLRIKILQGANLQSHFYLEEKAKEGQKGRGGIFVRKGEEDNLRDERNFSYVKRRGGGRTFTKHCYNKGPKEGNIFECWAKSGLWTGGGYCILRGGGSYIGGGGRALVAGGKRKERKMGRASSISLWEKTTIQILMRKKENERGNECYLFGCQKENR